MNKMYVVKRNGDKQNISFDKIYNRINYLTDNPTVLKHVNAAELTQLVIQGLVDGIKTSEIDEHTASLSANLANKHYDYLTLAGRIAINNHHKNTLDSFSDKVTLLYMHKYNNAISHKFNKFVNIHKNDINKKIDYNKDYKYEYFGFKSLEKGYLQHIKEHNENYVDGKSDKKFKEVIVERPQDMIMRVAIQLYMPEHSSEFREASLEKILHAYDMMSDHLYTHATPTLFNSGSNNPNLSSCFLLSSEDSQEGIMKTLTDCTKISKWSGGIGLHINNWRAEGSIIKGTNGKSNGVVPFLRMYNAGARAFDQGSKRNGSFSIYMELHHPDIKRFLELRLVKPGDQNLRCPDLFIALWMSDLFMKRLENGEDWSVFCPYECPGLNTTYGDEYEALYSKYESEGKARAKYDPMEIMEMIKESHDTSGLPYILYKDTINRSSMQNNIGVIQSSNLCAEIVLYSSSDETAVCNLSSICLPKFVEDHYSEEEQSMPEKRRRVLNHDFPVYPRMNWKKLAEIAGDITENLNRVIDITYTPTIEAARSNFKHRPIGIGVQGLADTFLKFGIAYDSDKAKDLNKKISEAIYYGSLSKSTELCRESYYKIMKTFAAEEATEATEANEEFVYNHAIYTDNILNIYPKLNEENIIATYKNAIDVPKAIGAYSSYASNGGSHLYNGKFHWELYGLETKDLSGLFDWESLRSHIKIFGVRNSMTTAYMPTGTTSNIMGCSPAFEPYVANVFKRKVIAGTFTIINKYLIKYLQDANIYTEKFNKYLLKNDGSIQSIDGIPDSVKALYKTSWEHKQSTIMQMAADRQPFIDQSQSMNLWFDDYSMDKFVSAQFFAWENKLKCGVYYTRTKEAVVPSKFTISSDDIKELSLLEVLNEKKRNEALIEEDTEEICIMCSS